MARQEKFLRLRGNEKELNTLVKSTHKQVFERTNCLDCGNCCKSAPPLVTSKDIKRIAKYLGLPPKTFKRNYVLEDIDGSLSFDSVPCRFLGEDNACSIYEVRPNACRSYPHTDDGDFLKRIQLHEVNAKICPAVNEILEIMDESISKTYNL
jgi:Fe-S-cluster containining protein